ncbi:hypothetical protein HUU39_07795 [candidate division KSB1 bacterium]|nr:hypothetical protein [candidate division KSB1 bacterium]
MRLKHTAVVAIFLLSFNAGFGQEEKPRIAVLDFESIGCDSSLGLAASEILRTELGSLGTYRIIERSQLVKVMEEQSLQISGAVDEQAMVEIGKLLGARMVVVGSIVRDRRGEKEPKHSRQQRRRNLQHVLEPGQGHFRRGHQQRRHGQRNHARSHLAGAGKRFHRDMDAARPEQRFRRRLVSHQIRLARRAGDGGTGRQRARNQTHGSGQTAGQLSRHGSGQRTELSRHRHLVAAGFLARRVFLRGAGHAARFGYGVGGQGGRLHRHLAAHGREQQFRSNLFPEQRRGDRRAGGGGHGQGRVTHQALGQNGRAGKLSRLVQRRHAARERQCRLAAESGVVRGSFLLSDVPRPSVTISNGAGSRVYPVLPSGRTGRRGYPQKEKAARPA